MHYENLKAKMQNTTYPWSWDMMLSVSINDLATLASHEDKVALTNAIAKLKDEGLIHPTSSFNWCWSR